jgi:hypothetical protein
MQAGLHSSQQLESHQQPCRNPRLAESTSSNRALGDNTLWIITEDDRSLPPAERILSEVAMLPKFVDIDGTRYLWRDIVQLRQEQCRAAALAAPTQPPLFELREDFRRSPNALPPPVTSKRPSFVVSTPRPPKEAAAGRLPSFL